MSKKNKENTAPATEEIHLDIPEDEIWTFQVPGLAAPHINKPYKNYTLKKIVFTVIILIAVSLSMYFSVRTVQRETFEYKQTETGYQLEKFSNTGYITELEINSVSEVVYDRENEDVTSNFEVVGDETKPVESIGPYALNCDGTVKVIKIGANVKEIDSKAFYSCWALERFEVDENNPNYCDVDGVLYSKDMKTVINYPCNHDQYLREKFGYEAEQFRADATEQYIKDIQTYVVPSTVETLGETALAYTNIRVLYLPEGLKVCDKLSVFKLHEPKDAYGNTPSLDNIYSYKAAEPVTDTHFTDESALGEVYRSLPEGLEIIESDAFSYNQELQYLYIPASVKHIGHHAFWDCIYKQDGELKGVTVINAAADEEAFKAVEQGDQWRPQYDYLLFKKNVDVSYGTQRAE